MDLTALADFNLVALHGGFGRASRSSGRSKTTLSRRVLELETALGVRLIDRGTHALRLTGEGRALHALTRGPLEEIGEAGRQIAAGQSEPSGTLRVSAPVVLAQVLLARIAAGFVAAHPKVSLEIVAEDRKADPVEDDYDVVIRVNPGPDERLVGRRIVEDRRLLVAAPGLSVPASSGAPDVPAVGRIGVPEQAWRIETTDGVRTLVPRVRLWLSSFLLIREAVLAGAGAALMPRLLVRKDVEAGRLACWGAEHGATVEIWALQNARRLSSVKTRAFLDALGALPT